MKTTKEERATWRRFYGEDGEIDLLIDDLDEAERQRDDAAELAKAEAYARSRLAEDCQDYSRRVEDLRRQRDEALIRLAAAEQQIAGLKHGVDMRMREVAAQYQQERDEAIARAEKAEKELGHTVTSWSNCEMCSQARTNFLTWLLDQWGLKHGDVSTDELQRRVLSTLDHGVEVSKERDALRAEVESLKKTARHYLEECCVLRAEVARKDAALAVVQRQMDRVGTCGEAGCTWIATCDIKSMWANIDWPPAEAPCKCSPKVRCDHCGWPLREDIGNGCTEANCSERPLPPRRTHCAECGGKLAEAPSEKTIRAEVRIGTPLEFKAAPGDFDHDDDDTEAPSEKTSEVTAPEGKPAPEQGEHDRESGSPSAVLTHAHSPPGGGSEEPGTESPTRFGGRVVALPVGPVVEAVEYGQGTPPHEELDRLHTGTSSPATPDEADLAERLTTTTPRRALELLRARDLASEQAGFRRGIEAAAKKMEPEFYWGGGEAAAVIRALADGEKGGE